MTSGEAGRFGGDVRSDLRVLVEAGSAAGLELELESKVAAYYGEAIRAQILELLGELGLTAARVTVQDSGALPFVIGARVEAAARRAGLSEGTRRTATNPPAATQRDALRRSRLYVPGNEPKYMINAGLHGADGIILDLEDSVHADEKDAARLLVRNALLEVDFQGAERMVRINQLPLGLKDLEEIVPAAPDLILLPKVEQAAEVDLVDRKINELQAALGTDRTIHLMPILETALGVENAFLVASASPRVVALTLGLEDLTADLGVVKTRKGEETLYARCRVVNAARAVSIAAIDSVFGDIDDLDGLAAWCANSRGLGFSGLGCVHPRQIPTIHRAFAPAEQEIERARKIVLAFQAAEAAGLGVVSLGSKMIDPPVVLRALQVLERARAMGLVDDSDNPETPHTGAPRA